MGADTIHVVRTVASRRPHRHQPLRSAYFAAPSPLPASTCHGEVESPSTPSVPTSHLLTDSEEYLTRLASHQPPPSILLRLVQTPRRFKDMTRLSVPEFIALYKELKPYILRSLPVERKRCHRHYPRSLHSADEFLLWVWHSDGTDADVLGFFFNGISRWTATRIADHVTTAVLDAWAEEVSWPDAEERRLLYGFFTCHEKAVGALDGTHCQISVPYFKEDRSMSGYKKFHTSYMICVDGLGFVIYTAGPTAGHLHRWPLRRYGKRPRCTQHHAIRGVPLPNAV